MPEIKDVLDLGVAGILFVMWWFERKDRIAAQTKSEHTKAILQSAIATSNELVQVVKDNTAAMSSLHVMATRNAELLAKLTQRMADCLGHPPGP